MNHVMLDLETRGTLPGSVILSIGAVKFDPVKLSARCIQETFYTVVSTVDSARLGFTQSASTREWWAQQSEAAREVLTAADASGVTVAAALSGLTAFLGEDAIVWSNGAAFDQPLLDVAYDRVGLPTPWKHWNGRCYRTMKCLCKNAKDMEPVKVLAYNALEDAKWQAKHLVTIARAMRITLK